MKLSLPASRSLWPPSQISLHWSHFTLPRQKVTGVLIALLMINWAVFLSLYTFKVQHSCEPLVGASTCTPCAEFATPQHFWQHINFLVKKESLLLCPEKGNVSKSVSNTSEKNNSETKVGNDERVEPKPPIIGPIDPKPPIIGPKELIEGLVVGSIVAVGAVVVGAPAIVATGVGMAVWLVASALLPS